MPLETHATDNNRFTTIQPVLAPVVNWRILLEKSFTACMLLLMANNASGWGGRCYRVLFNGVSCAVSVLCCNACWKALYTAEPSYLSELISPYVPARTLRSSNTYLLSIPTAVTSHFSSRSFSAPSTQNSLPQHIHSIDRLSTFKRQLKSHFFQSAFTV